MLNIAERGRGFFSRLDSPEKAARRAEKRAQKRLHMMHEKIDMDASDIVFKYTMTLERFAKHVTLSELGEWESEFLLRLGDAEEQIAERFQVIDEDRSDNVRRLAVQAFKSIQFQISHPNPAKPEAVPSLVRSRRAAIAWGLVKTEELTGQQIDYDWSVGLLGKALSGNVTKEELDEYQNNPPIVKSSQI